MLGRDLVRRTGQEPETQQAEGSTQNRSGIRATCRQTQQLWHVRFDAIIHEITSQLATSFALVSATTTSITTRVRRHQHPPCHHGSDFVPRQERIHRFVKPTHRRIIPCIAGKWLYFLIQDD